MIHQNLVFLVLWFENQSTFFNISTFFNPNGAKTNQTEPKLEGGGFSSKQKILNAFCILMKKNTLPSTHSNQKDPGNERIGSRQTFSENLSA